MAYFHHVAEPIPSEWNSASIAPNQPNFIFDSVFDGSMTCRLHTSPEYVYVYNWRRRLINIYYAPIRYFNKCNRTIRCSITTNRIAHIFFRAQNWNSTRKKICFLQKYMNRSSIHRYFGALVPVCVSSVKLLVSRQPWKYHHFLSLSFPLRWTVASTATRSAHTKHTQCV